MVHVYADLVGELNGIDHLEDVVYRRATVNVALRLSSAKGLALIGSQVFAGRCHMEPADVVMIGAGGELAERDAGFSSQQRKTNLQAPGGGRETHQTMLELVAEARGICSCLNVKARECRQ
jgi:hypothetical protein